MADMMSSLLRYYLSAISTICTSTYAYACGYKATIDDAVVVDMQNHEIYQNADLRTCVVMGVGIHSVPIYGPGCHVM